jgi:hypothetical protein
MKQLEKYKTNLRLELNNVYSYNTLVAIIDWGTKEIYQQKHYSQTTQKHINYVADNFDLILIKNF